MNFRIFLFLAALLSISTFCQAQRIVPSDGRFNFNIKSDVKGLEFISRLNPVSFQFDLKKLERKLNNSTFSSAVYDLRGEQVRKVRRTGFIAQEVAAAAEESGFNFTGLTRPNQENDLYILNYEAFVVPLVKAVQEQQELIDEQQYLLSIQKKRLEAMEREISSLSEKLNALMDIVEKAEAK